MAIKYKSIGKRIKECRESAGLTQEELSVLLDITKSSVYKFESGKLLPSSVNLIQIANALETTPDYLVQDSLIKIPEFPLAHDPILIGILKEVQTLPNSQQQFLLQMLKLWKENSTI